MNIVTIDLDKIESFVESKVNLPSTLNLIKQAIEASKQEPELGERFVDINETIIEIKKEFTDDFIGIFPEEEKEQHSEELTEEVSLMNIFWEITEKLLRKSYALGQQSERAKHKAEIEEFKNNINRDMESNCLDCRRETR